MRRFNVALAFVALLAGCLLSPFVLLDSGAQVSSSLATGFRRTTFAALGAPANGSQRWCSDCQATAPCTSGGTGAVATRAGGAWNCTTGGPSASNPFTDSTALVKGSADATKLLRFEADGLTTGATRVITPPDANTSLWVSGFNHTISGPTAARTYTFPDASATIARTDAANTFAASQIFTTSSTHGVARIGTGIGGFAEVSNSSVIGGGSFALAQDSGGGTYLNAASGQQIAFRNNNSNVATLSGSAFAVTPNTTFTGNVLVNGQYNGALNDAGNSSTAITINWNDANVQYVTMTGNATFTFSNPVSGGRYVLLLKQDATGSRTATWPAAVLWPGGVAPTLTTTAAKTDMITCVYDGVNSKYLCGANTNY